MEGVAFVGGFALLLGGLYFVFFHMKDYLDDYQAEEGAEALAAVNGPQTFRVATSNASVVPLVLRALEQARAHHPDIQYVLTMGEEGALIESIQNGSNDVIVVSPTVAWMPNVTVHDVTVKPPSILLDEGDIALKPLDTTAQAQKIICRRTPSALTDEFIQAFCARGL